MSEKTKRYFHKIDHKVQGLYVHTCGGVQYRDTYTLCGKVADFVKTPCALLDESVTCPGCNQEIERVKN